MKNTSTRLQEIVNQTAAKFRTMRLTDWEFRKAPGKWSKKEILGHLIDSAANNHQRFVRAQYADKTPISYDGDTWVKVQDYSSQDVKILIELWINYNTHLAHVISGIPEAKKNVLFGADTKESVTLEWIVKDYVRHLEHHLQQILG